MKLIIKRLFIFIMAVAMFSCSLSNGDSSKSSQKGDVATRAVSMNRPAVQVHPKKSDGTEIPISQVPMFVTFGYDDNGYSDGMQWAVDLMAGRTNPAGIGNVKTFDGAPATVSFYNCTYYSSNWISESPTYVKRAWRAAYDAGHEIGNHTKTHGHGSAYSVDQWNTEIDGCTAALSLPFDPNEPNTSPNAANGIGLSVNEIYGFRTPYLEYNDNLFVALKNKNMYDCSIEEGFQYLQDGTNFVWPYTLDNGSPGHDVQVEWGSKQPIQPQPGMWEMPVYTVIVPPELRETMKARVSWFDVNGGKITGFDYNLWVSFKMTKAEYLATLKHTLDLRLQGNRAPFMLGAHTDYYSSKYSTPAATVAERRAAMKEFLDYAQSKSAVRITSVNNILDWVKDPSPMGTLVNHTVTPSAGLNGSITPSTPQTVPEGSSITFTLKADQNHMVDKVLVNGVEATVSGNTVTVGYVDSATTVAASFKQIPAGEKFQGTYYWTYNPADEPVDMTTPLVGMKDLSGAVIATVPEALAERIAMEGSGFLPDGRLLNLANDSGWPGSRFLEVDQSVAPWGYDAQGQALVPWRSLAADPTVIPSGSDVYIKEFDGITVPSGLVHDGWFKAVDTSHSFSGFQVDIFTATYPHYQAINTQLNELSVFELVGPINQVSSTTITATHDTLGSIWPKGEVRVVTGRGEKFEFFTGPEHEIDKIYVNGAVVAYNTADNTYMMENVTSATTIHATYKPKGVVQYAVTSSAVNGTISASQTVKEGESATFTFAPASADFTLDSVLVDGVAVTPTPTSPYTIANVTKDMTIKAVYKNINITYHTITTPEGPIQVEAGTNYDYVIPQKPGYRVVSVLVDGVAISPIPTVYTFSNVAANHTIEVTYELIPVGGLEAVYTKGTEWSTGFGASVDIVNNGTEPVNGWTVTLTFPGNQTISGWNGIYTQVGNVVTITNTSWNGTIAPGGKVTIGMNGSYSGVNDNPTVEVK